MAFGKASGITKAATALAAAALVAHVAFLSLFAWRVVTAGPLGRVFQIVFALTAAVGLGSSFLGGILIRYGGGTKAGKLGLWLVAASTGLAAILLVVATITG